MPKRKNRKRNDVLDYLAYLGLRLFAMFVHMFPPEPNYRTARWIGDWMYRLDRRHRHRAKEHLRRSFPDWPEGRMDKVARRSMHAMLYLAIEVLLTTRLITPTRWRRHLRLHNMAEALRLVLRKQRGMIFLTGHFGNWEVLGYAVAALGFPVHAIARRLDNPYLDRHLLGVRQNRGMTILDKRGASAVAPEILDAGGSVGFIADQDAGRKGLFVDFFGRPASTYKAIALLAIRHEVPVVIGYGRRLDEGFHFDIGIHSVIHPEDWADKDDPVRWITQEYTTALEEIIRTAPEQYLWVHRRWKHRPGGETPGPDGIA